MYIGLIEFSRGDGVLIGSLRIVVPAFNDWISFQMLLQDLDKVAASLGIPVVVSAVDDGSTEMTPEALQNLATVNHLESVEIVRLFVNVGHQRAIAIGVCLAVDDADADAILVMDADGEDAPHEIANLLAAADHRKDFCVVAQRRKRSENLTFRLSYILYKFIFKLLTAKQIDFGNFSLLSTSYANRLVRVADLWNNLPAAILRSRMPITTVPTDRASRYAGKSKMNFTSLIVHGMSGISVYADTIFVRLLLLTIFSTVCAGISTMVVVGLRLFLPAHATPGWATTVTFGMVIILVQVLSVTLSSVLMLLNSRVQRLVVPIVDYKVFVSHRERLYGNPTG